VAAGRDLLHLPERREEKWGLSDLPGTESCAQLYRLRGEIHAEAVLRCRAQGATYELTAAYALPLEAACTELVFTGTVGTFRWTDALAGTTPAARNRGNYWWLGVAAPFQINPRARLTLGGAYTKGSENFVQIGAVPQFENTAAVGRGVGTISCAFTL
jgi:hypothetical protein